MLKDVFKDLGRYGAVGIELASCVLIGVVIGYIIDKKINALRPWGTLTFSIFGFLAGFKRLMIINKEMKAKSGGSKRD